MLKISYIWKNPVPAVIPGATMKMGNGRTS